MARLELSCPICRSVGFNSVQPKPAPTEVVTCASCGLKLSYGFLLRKVAPMPNPAEAPKPARPLRAIVRPATPVRTAARKPPIKRKAQKAKVKAARGRRAKRASR